VSLRRIAAASLAGALLAACSPSRPGIPVPAAGRDAPAGVGIRPRGDGVRARIVYVIHGDADYVYHDSAGRRRLADRDALAQAMEVGRGARAAEVLIFHQEPRRHRWSAPGGTAYRYRGGALVETRRYARTGPGSASDSPGESGADDVFSAEAALYGRSDAAAREAGADSVARIFVYFGHEIPASGGLGYSRSLPREGFTLAGFARGLARFGGEPVGAAKPFALIVLSACRGGTPATTSALFPYADRVLAAPTELHLSYLDTRALIPPFADADWRGDGDASAPHTPVESAARRVLDESFARLSASTQAPVALALYDARKAAAYLDGAPALRNQGKDPASARDPRLPHTAWRDCGEDPGFGPGGEEAGAQVRYRPGRFGRLKAKQGHSGWECL
jgi:hypothetical protein